MTTFFDPEPPDVFDSVKVTLNEDRFKRCKQNASANGKGWVAVDKKGTWGGAIGKQNNLDVATFMGCKGEHAVSQWVATHNINLKGNDDRTVSPDSTCDFKNFPEDGKCTEVKTHNTYATEGLIRSQVWNERSKSFEWVRGKVKGAWVSLESCKGLPADTYIFCRTGSAHSDNTVEIMGWITRDEIISNHGSLRDAKRKRGSVAEWKNYEIPFKSLHPVDQLVKK